MNLQRQTIFFLLTGSALQFLFRQSLFSIAPLPLHAPFLPYLGLIGTFGLFLYLTSSLLFISFSIRQEKLLLPMGFILLGSSVVPALWTDYNTTVVWFWVVLLSVILSLVVIVRSMFRLRGLDFLLIPVFLLALYSYYPYVLLTLHWRAPTFPSSLLLLLASVSFLSLVLLKRLSRKRELVAILLGAGVSLSFLPLLFEVLRNRFLQMIMDMVIPSTLGIVFLNPYDLILSLVSLSLSSGAIVIALGKGLYRLATGYLLLITTCFLGYTGFHLMLYLFSPALGAFLLSDAVRKSTKVVQEEGLASGSSPQRLK